MMYVYVKASLEQALESAYDASLLLRGLWLGACFHLLVFLRNLQYHPFVLQSRLGVLERHWRLLPSVVCFKLGQFRISLQEVDVCFPEILLVALSQASFWWNHLFIVTDTISSHVPSTEGRLER